MRSNFLEAWDRLLLFATFSLKLPRRRGKHSESLSSLVRRQLQGCPASSDQLMPTHRRGKQRKQRKLPDPEQHLARQVSAKLVEGDFRGAIRLACSEDTLADFSEATYDTLCAKHPPAHPNSEIPPAPIVSDGSELDVQTSQPQMS